MEKSDLNKITAEIQDDQITAARLDWPSSSPGGAMTLTEAQIAIAKTLKQLEEDTGRLVTSISIVPIETTRMADHNPQHRNRIVIETQRLPGHDWETG